VKIAISAREGAVDSDVDPRFGRARFFVVIRGDDQAVEVLDNTGTDELSHGAGVAAVETMVRHGVTTVLTGQVGPKADQALRAAGIEVVTGISGSCRDAVATFLHGRKG
jgi:predicted Fe-Mo cluster-binding NifX family protein